MAAKHQEPEAHLDSDVDHKPERERHDEHHGRHGDHAESRAAAARAYNRRHPQLVEEFNQLTHDECGSGSEVSPAKVRHWQAAHHLDPDGRVGPLTVEAARTGGAPKHKPEPDRRHHGGAPGPHADAPKPDVHPDAPRPTPHVEAPKPTPHVDAPKPEVHADAPKPAPHVEPPRPAPQPEVHADADGHHEAEKKAKEAGAPTTGAPGQHAEGAHAEPAVPGSRLYHLGGGLPPVLAFLPPGGVKGAVDVFMFFHGMYAHYDTTKAGVDNPANAAHMAQAMAATKRNVIALAPMPGLNANQFPKWASVDAKHGYATIVDDVLAQLSSELGSKPALTKGAVSLAGHSAGGIALGEAAEELGDLVRDVTLQDAGYNGASFQGSFTKLVKWFLTGHGDKTIRVITHGEPDKVSEGNVLSHYLNPGSLKSAAEKSLKLHGITATLEPGDKAARTVPGMHLHHRLRVSGADGSRLVSVYNFNKGGGFHYEVRNQTMGNLIGEGPETDFATDGSAPQKGPAPVEPQKPDAPKPEVAHPPKPEAHHDAKPDVVHPPKPVKPEVAHPPVPDVVHEPKFDVAHAPKPDVQEPKKPDTQAVTAPKPASTEAPPAVAVVNEGDLEKRVAELGNAKVSAVYSDVKALIAKSEELRAATTKKEKSDLKNEMKADGRSDFLKQIEKVHGEIGGLDGAGVEAAKLQPVKARMFRILQEVSPYHSQGRNVDILENNARVHAGGQKTRTCNVTSLSMALEGLGKGAHSYTGDRDTLLAIAKVFRPELKGADLDAGGEGWAAMEGLRLPDFMELAAIALVLGSAKSKGKTPDAPHTDSASILAAANTAFDSILNMDFLRKLALQFGVSAQLRYFSYDPDVQTHQVKSHGKSRQVAGTDEADVLGGASKDQRHKVDAIIDARNAWEALPEGKQKEKAFREYKALKDASAGALSGAAIEKRLPIEKYKEAVIKQFGAYLSAGAAIETHVTQHFVRVHAIEEDYVIIDDPAQVGRAHKKVLWEEGRAEALFDKNLVIQ